MTAIGGYTLDLYCAQKDCPHKYALGWNPREYTGEYGATCRAQARRDGWLLPGFGRLYNTPTKCPDCRGKKG